MKYDPIKYWTNRDDPAPNPLPGYVEKYINKHIKSADTILDFGVGKGRCIHLYKGKYSAGYDIVPRDISIPFLYKLEGSYDVIVASKVFLHIKPEQIEKTIGKLKCMGKKIVVYDTVAECKAPHNFNHDFRKFGEMKDVQISNAELLFIYK